MPVALVVAGMVAVGVAAAFLFLRASPSTIVRLLRMLAFALVGALGLMLMFRGRPDLGFLFLGLIPLIRRFIPVPGFGQVGGGTASGATSTVSTAWLDMTLDTSSGAVAGEVRQGRFAGRRLADLTLDDLLTLRGECAHDAQSVALIEAFLDRVHGSAWRADRAENETADGEDRKPAERMTVARACAVLGVAPGASVDQIKAAHRRLMKKMHPDHGGTAALAAEINAARDILLKGAGGT